MNEKPCDRCDGEGVLATEPFRDDRDQLVWDLVRCPACGGSGVPQQPGDDDE
jgi:hypothetical protein